MTFLDLYRRLKKKGYKAPCGNHSDHGYCCAEAAWEFRKYDDLEVTEGVIRNHLELDRRNVFRRWYGTKQKKLASRQPSPSIKEWEYHLHQADLRYRAGKISSCIDYIISSAIDE